MKNVQQPTPNLQRSTPEGRNATVFDLEERLLNYAAEIIGLVQETEELIRIFAKSIKTAKAGAVGHSKLNVGR